MGYSKYVLLFVLCLKNKVIFQLIFRPGRNNAERSYAWFLIGWLHTACPGIGNLAKLIALMKKFLPQFLENNRHSPFSAVFPL